MELGKAALLAVAFGLLVTSHVALCAALLGRTPRVHAALALVLPPLAPYFGLREGRRIWSALWFFSLVTYALSVFSAAR